MHPSTRRRFLKMSGAALVVSGLHGLPGLARQPGPVLPFQSRGRIRAGVPFDIPGMGFRNPVTGRVEGFEADLARAITARLLGSADQVELVAVTNEQRIPFLQQGRVDMVLSQLTITPERAEQVDFSIPYYTTHEALLVLAGSPIQRFEDLKARRIAVTAGSVSLPRMRASLPSLPGATLVITELNRGSMDALDKGTADVAANDAINLAMMRQATPHPEKYRVIDLGERFAAKPYGVAVQKGSPDFVALLNRTIEALKAQGAIDRLLQANLAALGTTAARP